MQPRNILAKKQALPPEKQGDLIEVGVELETHFNNESNIDASVTNTGMLSERHFNDTAF
jgi:hypothetical protein